MNHVIVLKDMLAGSGRAKEKAVSIALLCLGIVESLSSGAISASEAVRYFFHADNCLYVRKHFKEKSLDELMSRGVQLPDLFEALPPEEANRECHRELTIMRSLCLKLLEEKQAVA
jgi:hypothetical protein